MWLKLTEQTANQTVLINSERVCHIIDATKVNTANREAAGCKIVFSDSCQITVKEPFDEVMQHLVDILRSSALTTRSRPQIGAFAHFSLGRAICSACSFGATTGSNRGKRAVSGGYASICTILSVLTPLVGINDARCLNRAK